MIGPSQSPLPDNTQHSQQTDILAPGGFRTRNPSKRAAGDPHVRPRGHISEVRLPNQGVGKRYFEFTFEIILFCFYWRISFYHVYIRTLDLFSENLPSTFLFTFYDSATQNFCGWCNTKLLTNCYQQTTHDFFKLSQLGAHYFLVYLFELLYMYRATMNPWSGELTVSARHWYLSLCMGGCLIC